ncbi:hypothetical protein [Pseudonocardia humida]|uniref:Uncharacterized protein n=1 Tax=Pseudonocardia humida TaxID=2800819 RepID=A0ABT1A533_9PSEU|nr:hypothetical protein [Pseudonocardia humida]MCO1658127.1 hypothetical protein [Pseudonocardia humida]
MTEKEWLGEDWEEWCLLLMRRKYGADEIQRVPARHRGDLGIEAFTFSGHAFQCYATQGFPSVKERYEKQRDKLTVDLGKLISKKDELCKLLGSVKIKRYMFLVPVFESSQIVQHAATKTEECREHKLPHLHDDFRVVVVTDDDYADERRQILEQPRDLVVVAEPDESDIASWIGEHEALVEVANHKLSAIISNPIRRKEYLQSLITQHVFGNNTLSALRPRYPDQWESATRNIYRKERLLVLEHSIDGRPTSQNVTSIAKDLQRELEQNVPTLGEPFCRAIAWSAVADWLMRCPLEFYGEDHSESA